MDAERPYTGDDLDETAYEKESLQTLLDIVYLHCHEVSAARELIARLHELDRAMATVMTAANMAELVGRRGEAKSVRLVVNLYEAAVNGDPG